MGKVDADSKTENHVRRHDLKDFFKKPPWYHSDDHKQLSWEHFGNEILKQALK